MNPPKPINGVKPTPKLNPFEDSREKLAGVALLQKADPILLGGARGEDVAGKKLAP